MLGIFAFPQPIWGGEKGKKASSTQVPEVVRALKDKYGLPKDIGQVLPASGLSAISTLSQLVDLQRISYPQACVTSTFYDYRTVSIYRSHAGLHLGYDIAMPAGAEVRVGWPGVVVSIAPWYTNQWGVTISSSNRTEVTYGHIVPTVRLGDTLGVGDVVGKVSLDHVDVKMRDANGNYIPFGESGAPSSTTNYALLAVPSNSRESLMVGWLVAQNAVDTMETELQMRKKELKSAEVGRSRLEERYSTLHKQEVKMQKYQEDGLVSRADVEKVRSDLNKVRAQLLLAKQMQNEVPQQLKVTERQLTSAKERLAKAKKAANQAGIGWNEVTAFVNRSVAQDKKLSSKVQDYKKSHNTQNEERRQALKKQINDLRQQQKEYKKLYEEGGLPRKELEALEERLRLAEDELKDLQ